jgi:hypothetical protein
MKHVLTSLAALAFCAFGVGAVAAPAESAEPAGMEGMQHWAADHAAMLDAKLAGLKAGLKLTSEQEELWTPFEAAVRDAAKLHMDQMKAMMGRMQNSNEMQDMGPPGEATSPIDRLEALAKHMSERGAAMLSVAKPPSPSMRASTTRRSGSFACSVERR